MAKGTLEVAEYQWAQKFYKHNSWPFDEYDGDPTPASIEAHCKSRSAQYKAELTSYKALKHTLESDAQVQTFDSLCDQTQSRMKNADDLLQAGNFLDADSTLDDIAALVDGVGILVGKSRATEQQKNAESSVPHVDPLQALQQRATEFSAKLKGYKAERKILVSKDQKTLFDQLFKQAASTMTYVTGLVKRGDVAGADQRLFDAEAQLQGVQQVLEMQKQTVRETESIKTAIKEANTRLSEANGLRKTIKSPQEQKAFVDSSKQAKGQIKQIEGLLKRHELDACQAELKTLDNLVEKTESYVKFVPVDPSLSRELKTTRIEIQSCYQQVNEVPDKALKRDFEKNYQVAINLLAETEDLIEGHGRSSEEAITANLATLKTLTETLIDCVVGAKEATNQPTERRSQPNTDSKNAAQNALNKALADCMKSLDETQANLNDVLKAGVEIKDAALASSFAQYSNAAQTYITEGKQYAADRKLQEARGKLATCGDAITSMKFLLESAQAANSGGDQTETSQSEENSQNAQHSTQQSNEQRLAEERQQAGAYRKALNTAQRAVKKLEAQQPQIKDPSKQQRYATLLVQVGELISEIGSILATSHENRLQLAAQLMPRLDGCILQAQDIYDGAMIAQQNEELLQKQANDYRTKTKEVAAKAAVLRKNKAVVTNRQQSDQLAVLLQQITEKIREINIKLNSRDPNRVDVAESLLPSLYAVLQQAQSIFEAAKATEQQSKEPKQKEITYKHAKKGIRNYVDSRAKPSGRNPEFYCEEQDGMFCLKHSMNACLGFGAISVEDMEEGLLQANVDGFKEDHQRNEKLFFDELKIIYPNLTLNEMRKQVGKDPDKFYRDAAKAKFQVFMGGTPADAIRAGGSDPRMGIEIMKSKQKELGLPDLKDEWLEPPKSEEDMQKNLKKLKEITDTGADRMVLGAGAHFIALRKNAEDDWFEVDSQEPSAKRIDLEQYIRKQARIHKTETLALLHFGGELDEGNNQKASQPRR